VYQIKQKRTNGRKLSRYLYELKAAKEANKENYELAIILYTRALDYHERYGNRSNARIKRLIEEYKNELGINISDNL